VFVRGDASLASLVIYFEMAGVGTKGRYFAYSLSLNATVIACGIAFCGDLVRVSDS
jgi:hypothetical protein